ncbi:MAG: GNAT family N-acetyltransferase [Candidatus Cloacimonetes bacterium]|nr:GNAT family N-acetyltransferase [Candidatus Cloacimonadota bacterium]
MNNTLLTLLESNPTANIAALGFFANYPVEDYYIIGNSALIFGRSDNLWAHIASTSEADIARLLETQLTQYYFSVENWMIPLILKHGEIDWIVESNRYILDDSIPVNEPEITCSVIDTVYAEVIYNNSDYKDYISVDYISDRLVKGVSAGIIVNNNLVAWGFTHDDGALGFLHVLPEYRKRGFAMAIMQKLIQMRRNNNEPNFGNVVPDNVASIGLISKLGFRFDRKVSWIKLNPLMQ